MNSTEPHLEIGRVIGTEDSTPLEFWVAVKPGCFLQLDDVVALERELPTEERVSIYGVVTQVRARHEGAKFDSDVFLISEGSLPAEVSEAAQITTTRFEPETFIPPKPGDLVIRAEGEDRDQALFFDAMEHRVPAGMSRTGEVININLEFLNGQRGAHVNISGISGVATKTSFATFLVHSLFTCGELGNAVVNTKALIFNVKGEDLLHLDQRNTKLDEQQRQRYQHLGLPSDPFGSVRIFAPPIPGSPHAQPQIASRTGVSSYFWTLADFCRDDMLELLFADAEDDRAQYTMVLWNVMSQLRKTVPVEEGAIRFEDHPRPRSGTGLEPIKTDEPAEPARSGNLIRTFSDLVELITDRLLDDDYKRSWAGPAIGTGTIQAFIRRLHGAKKHVEHLIRADIPSPEQYRINLDGQQVTVVDIHNLHDRAKRFVVGAMVRDAFEQKERKGQSAELLLLVLDELNKYAPREGYSPIKETLVDVSERGRSLGVILIGAQQTASEVERRIITNSSIRVVGRLDAAEAGREEYGFLPTEHRKRATILKPGTMLMSQPEIPVPLLLEFPFPAWATRASEAEYSNEDVPEDPFQGLTNDKQDGTRSEKPQLDL